MILSEHVVRCDTDGKDFNTFWYQWTVGRLQQVFMAVWIDQCISLIRPGLILLFNRSTTSKWKSTVRHWRRCSSPTTWMPTFSTLFGNSKRCVDNPQQAWTTQGLCPCQRFRSFTKEIHSLVSHWVPTSLSLIAFTRWGSRGCCRNNFYDIRSGCWLYFLLLTTLESDIISKRSRMFGFLFPRAGIARDVGPAACWF